MSVSGGRKPAGESSDTGEQEGTEEGTEDAVARSSALELLFLLRFPFSGHRDGVSMHHD